MRWSFAVIPVILLFGIVAAAQDNMPQMETFLGFTYVKVYSATNVPSINAGGGNGQFVYNVNKWIGGVAEIGAVHNGNINGYHIDNTIADFLCGPRVAFHYPRIRPYFQILWGGVYLAASTRIGGSVPESPTAPSQPIFLPGEGTPRLTTSKTAFAMTVGGGLDMKINKHVSFRPVELDYYLTRLQNLRTLGDNRQNNLMYQTGFNFTFGAAQ